MTYVGHWDPGQVKEMRPTKRKTILLEREMGDAFPRKPIEPVQRQARQVAMERNIASIARSGQRVSATPTTLQNAVNGIPMVPQRGKPVTKETKVTIQTPHQVYLIQTIKRPLLSRQRK